MSLPLKPPFAPQLARSAKELPEGDGWRYEPKWDGFRTLVFRDGDDVHLQSRTGKEMNRYFPEVVDQVRAMAPQRAVLDGEVIVVVDGVQEFDKLSQRIHPAASRVERLAKETPAAYVAFDLLASEDESLLELPYDERRERLGALGLGHDEVTPMTDDAGGRRGVAAGPLRGRDRQAGRRAVPAGRAQGHGQDQARAHRRRGGCRLPDGQGGEHGRLADPRPLRRRRRAAHRGPHLRLPRQAEARAARDAGALPHPRARLGRAQPLEVRRGARVGGAATRARVSRSPSTTSPASGSATAPSSCAGARTSRRASARSRNCGPEAGFSPRVS